MTGAPDAPLEDARGVCKAAIENAQTFLKPEQAAAMVEEFVAGATKKSLAEKYRVHEQTVRAHVRRAGAECPDRVTAEVLAEFASGVPVSVLAARCGVCPDTILRRARSAGILPELVGLIADQVDRIIGLYQRGARITQIGNQFGLGVRQTRQVLTDAGVEIRPRGRRPMLDDRRAEVERLRGNGWCVT